MKKTIILISGILLLSLNKPCFCSTGSQDPAKTGNGAITENSIHILSSPDLSILTNKWASEYKRLNQGIEMDVRISDGGSADLNNISFLSDDDNSAIKNENNWKMVVGRVAIVPVINSKNPFLQEILKRGISPEEISLLLTKPENLKWGTLLENGENAHVNYYWVDDPSIQSTIGNFLNKDQIFSEGIKSENVQKMISEIQKDPYALGFCRMTDALHQDKQSLTDNIILLPIDKNGNGKLDQFENIYGDLNTFMRGVWIGKYPSTLCRNIYSVASAKPVNENEIAFLKWVLTDGQKYLNPNGYFDLVNNERQAKIDLLTDNSIYLSNTGEGFPFTKALIMLIAIIAIAFLAIMGFRFFMKKGVSEPELSTIYTHIFDENSVSVPKGLYFDKSHTWAYMEKNGSVRIGVDDFLQHVTGPVTRIKMKQRGEKINKGEPVFSLIQNGKQLNIHAPVSGTIISYNETLTNDSSVINSSPYADGWIYLIEPSNWLREIQFMILGDKFTAWLNSEFSRLKDFFASSAKVNSFDYSHVVLQDGGAIKDNILSDFGPEVWEDFQIKFIDTSK